VARDRRTDVAEWRGSLVTPRIAPQHVLIPPGAPAGLISRGDAEEQHVAARMPRFRDVAFTGGGGGQAFGPAASVRGLPENARIPLPVRLECDSLAVGGPHGESVLP